MFCLQLIDLSCYSLVSIFHYKAQRVTATPYTLMFLLCPLKGQGYTGWCSPCTLMPRPSPLNLFTLTRWDHGGYLIGTMIIIVVYHLLSIGLISGPFLLNLFYHRIPTLFPSVWHFIRHCGMHLLAKHILN